LKTAIIETPVGIFALTEDNKIIEKALFTKNPQKTAEKLHKLENGKLTEEIITIINQLKNKGYTTFTFENSQIAQNAEKQFKVEAITAKPSKTGEHVRRNLQKIAVEVGFVKDAEELNEWTRKLTIELTKLKVKKAVEKRDLTVAQAIQTVDDLDKTINLLMARIREWYGLHFPELDRLIDKHETYTRLIITFGNRENFTAENLEKEGLPKSRAEQIAKAASTSMGAELVEKDVEQLQTICKVTAELNNTRQTLEGYVDSVMEEVAPNIKAIVGSLLGARLIALAGGLENLAKMPASTIQVLGAEKALFRALKTGTRPPKHGIIFQHTFIREAKKWQRGKVARAIAGKLAIAARTDAFGGKYAGDELKADLEKRITEVMEKYREPPARRPQQQREFFRRRRRERRG